ncbi:hypothetical protein [Pectobacterium carotovorum]|uniref:hypothetical protein n=1 Tax=Pectobacterium carotovorum TaxID=554 RepID=UPI00207F5262|nr:hypothetical protein [Pectobacterium carotovorum]GKV89300.1 hypothetical protein PEC301619_12820 [Pectobacterium carotovorum subsp. carotovorum]
MSELTFRHFIDKPTWAAADGYNFNFIDCLAFSAKLIDPWYMIKSLASEVLDTELRDIYVVPIYLGSMLLAISWPLIFWVVSIPLWIKCKRWQRKYKHEMNDTARENLDAWRRRLEIRWEVEDKNG